MNSHSRIILLLVLVVGSFLTGMIYSDIQNAIMTTEIPDNEYNVTCYSWTENGTHNVWCPEKVYAPNRAVNITVENKKPMENPL